MTSPRILSLIASLILITSLVIVSDLTPKASASGYIEYFHFTTITTTWGYGDGEENIDAQDSAYFSVVEQDMYSDQNHTVDDETVNTGTAGGDMWPDSFYSDDASRRSYTEANTASASDVKCMMPSADSAKTWDGQTPSGSTTHYDLLDERTSGGDGDTSSVNTNTTAEYDIYDLTDETFSGSPTYDIRFWVIAQKKAAQADKLTAGIRIGSTNYAAITDQNLVNGAWTNYSKGWTTDPSDSNEWTSTDLANLQVYIVSADIAPTPYVTQIGVKIWANYTPSYELDVSLVFDEVYKWSNNSYFRVICQGYRSASENFNIYAWDFTISQWDLKTTIQAAADTDYNFDLTTDERDFYNDYVYIRITDASGGDSVQDTVYFDMLKVSAVDLGFHFEVDMTSEVMSGYGDIRIRARGYTTGAELCRLRMFYHTSSSWQDNGSDVSFDTTEATDSINITWTVDLGTNILVGTDGLWHIRWYDYPNYTSDKVRDTAYINFVWAEVSSRDPILSDYGPTEDVLQDETVHFYLTVTDHDNHLPNATWPKVNIGGSSYSMTENNSGDTKTFDGKTYYLDKSDLPVGYYEYTFSSNDIYSAEKFSATRYLNVSSTNQPPWLYDWYRFPDDEPSYLKDIRFYVYIADNQSFPDVVKWREDNGTTQNITMILYLGDYDDCIYYTEDWISFSVGIHWFDFWASDDGLTAHLGDFSLTISNRDPIISSGPLNQNQYRNHAWAFDLNATDPDYDTISWGRSGADWLSIDSGGYLSGTTPDTPGEYPITVYANDSYGGQDTWPFTITVINRPPVIISQGNTSQIWMTYFSYEVQATDPDSDDLSVEFWSNCTDLALDNWYINGTVTTVGIYDVHVWVNDTWTGDTEFWELEIVENQAPYFTTTGRTSGVNGTAWDWTPTAIDPDDWPDQLEFSLATNASWMQINSVTGRVNGTPTAPGIFYYNITVSDGNKTSSLNTTLTIMETQPMDVYGLVMTLAFGFGLMAAGFWRREFWLVSGMVWIFGGIFYLTEVHIGFTIISIGVGSILLLSTAVEYLESPERTRQIKP